jgi:C-terminal processing protease CtpA/Prc
VEDYNVLEQIFAGNNQTNGMEFGLAKSPDSNFEVIGFVKYILPNSNASTTNLKRGDIFYAINGTPLTLNNYRSLISPPSYTLNLANYDEQNETLTPNNSSVSLSKTNYSENPIYINQVINTANNKVGYLMYNGFIGSANNDVALNNVFGEFKSEGVNELVLDLRYNPGGSVRSAIWLASMITGDYTGETLIKRQWNSEIQQSFEAENPEALIDTFQDAIVYRNSNGETLVNEAINHLNLNRVYVLTSPNSASASELVINGLKPYIEVIQIGTKTAGKYQASTTIYDSPELVNKQGVNPLHNYALQPLIFKISNANDVTDFDDGLSPSIAYEEQLGAFGIIGDVEEPLLKKALNAIEGIDDDRSSRTNNKSLKLIKLKDSYKQLMYLSLE